MKRCLVLLLALAALASPLTAGETHRYIVGTRGAARIADLRMVRDVDAAAQHEVRLFDVIPAFAADLTDEEVAELRASRSVRYVSPVVKRSLNDAVPPGTILRFPAATGVHYDKQQVIPWGIDKIHARDVWPATRGNSTSVNVAILDTGLDKSHPDLAGRFAGGYNTFDKTDNVKDDNKHGTHVAGTIGADDNTFGVVGVAPEVKIWSVKVLDGNGDGTDETLIAGIDWVLAKKHEIGGNWILNFSLGGVHSDGPEEETFRRGIAEGLLIIAAAGNRYIASVDYPALYTDVVSVAATDSTDEKAGFSSYGTGLYMSAPGVDVVSTVPVGSVSVADVETDSGTFYTASFLTGSPKGEVKGSFVYCGLGKPEDFPATVNGKIAVVLRGGGLYFRDKVKAAKAAGAIGVVLINDDDNKNDMPWTLLPLTCTNEGCVADPEDLKFPFPVTISISNADGKKLLDQQGKTDIIASYHLEDYTLLNGTSMATPHVVAASALAWSLAPNATAEQLRIALALTSKDLHTPGWDSLSGYGLLDALALAKYMSPGSFGLSEPPPVQFPRRRSGGH